MYLYLIPCLLTFSAIPPIEFKLPKVSMTIQLLKIWFYKPAQIEHKPKQKENPLLIELAISLNSTYQEEINKSQEISRKQGCFIDQPFSRILKTQMSGYLQPEYRNLMASTKIVGSYFVKDYNTVTTLMICGYNWQEYREQNSLKMS